MEQIPENNALGLQIRHILAAPAITSVCDSASDQWNYRADTELRNDSSDTERGAGLLGVACLSTEIQLVHLQRLHQLRLPHGPQYSVAYCQENAVCVGVANQLAP